MSFLVDSYVFVTGGGNEAFVGGGYNGAFGGSTDEFFTFNIDTDTWSSVVTFPYTTYNQGGAGSSTDTIFWGGYNSGGGSNPTLTQKWNGTSFSAGGHITWSGNGQSVGNGSGATNSFVSSNNASYGTNSTWEYNLSWSTGNNITYYQRQGAQGGDTNTNAIVVTGFGGNTGGSAGASARSEACTRNNSTFGSITSLSSHQSWQHSGGAGGVYDSFSFLEDIRT